MDSLYSRYAEALFTIAIEENKVSYYTEEIKMLKGVFNDNPEFMHLLSSYFIEFKDKENVIDNIYPNNSNIANFIKIIVKNNRSYYLMKIFDEFIERANSYSGVKEGIIYSVNKLDKNQISKIEEAMSVKLNTKVELINQVDEKLIGGVKVVVEDKIFDGSIKNKLDRLKEELIKGGK